MGMGGASDQIFVFKALTSSIGLLASGLLVQGLSSAIGLFASDLLLQGFDRLEARIGKQVDEYGRLAL